MRQQFDNWRMEFPDLEHDAWPTVVGTLLGYGVILAVMTVLLFAIPYLIFLQL